MTASPGSARPWRERDERHIDVRDLPPPEPLVEVPPLIDSAPDPDSTRLVMHHDRAPLLLFPELRGRGCQYELQRAARAEILIYIDREQPAGRP